MAESAVPAAAPAGDHGASLSADPAVRRTMRALGSVVAPVTLLSSLLYYFGWTFTHASASYLGIDESVLGFSTQDYLLRSINAVFWPLSVGLIVAALALRGHVVVMRSISQPQRTRRIEALGIGLAVAGLGAAIYGGLAIHYDWVGVADFTIAPLCLTIGVALLGYAVLIREWLTSRAPNATADSTTGSASLATVAVALLIAVGLFWQVAEWATAVGIGRTRDLIARLDAQPQVTVYSGKRLGLAGTGGVTETPLGGTDTAYRYRYTGLRLLFRSGGTYLLLSDHWSRADGRTFLIDDTPDLRFEFTPGR